MQSSTQANDRVMKNMGYTKERSDKLDLVESNIRDQHELYFTRDFLYQLKDYYKKTHPCLGLECQ